MNLNQELKNEVFIDRAKELSLSKLASLTRDEKLKLISLLKNQLEEPSYEIPINIFENKVLGSLESIVKYLVENLQLGFTEISNLTQRSDKTIWVTYNEAKKKMPDRLAIKKSQIFIPLNILKNRKLSVLENIVAFLRENCMLSFNEISSLLKRKYTTITTVYRRALQKRK